MAWSTTNDLMIYLEFSIHLKVQTDNLPNWMGFEICSNIYCSSFDLNSWYWLV